MTLKARLAHLEQHEADAWIRSLVPLSDDAFFARLATIHTEPPPHLRQRMVDEILRRFRMMSEEEMDACIRAHSTPEEYAQITAMSDAELEAAIAGNPL